MLSLTFRTFFLWVVRRFGDATAESAAGSTWRPTPTVFPGDDSAMTLAAAADRTGARLRMSSLATRSVFPRPLFRIADLSSLAFFFLGAFLDFDGAVVRPS